MQHLTYANYSEFSLYLLDEHFETYLSVYLCSVSQRTLAPWTTRRFSNHVSCLLSRSHTFAIIVILDLKIHQRMWIHWLFFPKTWTKGHWPLDDLWPHVCWGHMCDSTQGSLCPSPMTIHQCMWIQWSILQNTTYVHTYMLHTYYVQNEWSHSLLLNSVQARKKTAHLFLSSAFLQALRKVLPAIISSSHLFLGPPCSLVSGTISIRMCLRRRMLLILQTWPNQDSCDSVMRARNLLGLNLQEEILKRTSSLHILRPLPAKLGVIFTCLTPVEPKIWPLTFPSITMKRYVVDRSNYTFSES